MTSSTSSAADTLRMDAAVKIQQDAAVRIQRLDARLAGSRHHTSYT